MRTLVVYDSAYGNTEQVARAVGAVLETQLDVEIQHVRNVKPEQLGSLELLIVGGPTQRFRPTQVIMSFLKRIPPAGLAGVRVAAFDTRLAASDFSSSILRFIINTGGYAAKPIAEQLVRCGGTLVAPPEGFFVAGTEGPPKPGELERAAAWAGQILAAATAQGVRGRK